jgi:vitamin K-dependent gamma-carboxylase
MSQVCQPPDHSSLSSTGGSYVRCCCIGRPGRWCLVAVKGLLVVVYTYAAIAKVNEDWLRAEPLRKWLVIPYKFFPLLETFIYRESVAYALSYGGLVYDLAVGPMLLFRRTFWLAVAMTMFFHISNKLLFNIGIFPIFMIASTSFFFDPSWPRILIAMLRRLVNLPVHSLPKLGASWRDTKPRSLTCKNWLVLFGISAFLLLMVLIPLRCYTYPGTTAWHEYGHKFSWRMKLRTKQVHVSEPSFNCMHMLSLSLTH